MTDKFKTQGGPPVFIKLRNEADWLSDNLSWVPIKPRKKGYAPNYLNNKKVSPEKFKKFYEEEIEYFQKYQNKLSSPEGLLQFKYGAWWDGKPVVYQDNSDDDSDF